MNIENTEGAIKNEQSRETCTTGYTKLTKKTRKTHRTLCWTSLHANKHK